jgi:hypothetical protein
MKYWFLSNSNRPLLAPLRVGFCDTFLCQLRGMMFRSFLDPGEGLLLVQKKDSRLDASIHMMFMAFDLGIVWIDSSGAVVDLLLARRWRPAYFPKQPACWTLEIHLDRLKEFNIGDKIYLEDLASV